MNAYQLARVAGVASPDSPESPGAKWLELVAVSAEEVEDEEYLSEVADQLVPIYTHERWQVFVDLAAYQEDATELGDGDMTQLAGNALYMVAERLLRELFENGEEE